MKRIGLCLFVFIISITINGYSQAVGACCAPVPNFPHSCSGPTTLANCEDGTAGRLWLGPGSTCRDANGDNNCSKRWVCCYQGQCLVGVSQEDCDKSAGANHWFQNGTCPESCQSTSVIVDSFYAVYLEKANHVQVSWLLDSRSSINDFYVERSRDNEKFKPIGLSDKNSINNNTYTFTDINPYQVGYYRLSFFSNGRLTYSQVISVVGVEKGKLLLLPNPATSKVKILLSNMQLYSTDVSVMDVSGRLLLNQKLNGAQHEINIQSLPQGTFIIRVKSNGNTYTGKLLKN